MLRKAILRAPGPEITNALSMHANSKIDFDQALKQHQVYTNTLKDLKITVQVCDANPEFPDGCFVEDTHLILPEVVFRLNPGALSRLYEPESLQDVIPNDRPYVTLPKDLTIDGGDVLLVGKSLYIGLSKRTTEAAISIIQETVRIYGYDVITVPVPLGLHLKSGVTCLNENTFILQPAFEDILKKIHQSRNQKKEYFVLPSGEENAANVLPINDSIVIPPGCPKAQEFIHKFYPLDKIFAVDTSEFRKVDGALTCLSILYN